MDHNRIFKPVLTDLSCSFDLIPYRLLIAELYCYDVSEPYYELVLEQTAAGKK